MKRFIVLVTLLATGALAVGAQQQGGGAAAPGPKVIETEKLADNLFVLRGANGGGNTAVFITTTGVVVVDTKNPGWGRPILDAIGTLTNRFGSAPRSSRA